MRTPLTRWHYWLCRFSWLDNFGRVCSIGVNWYECMSINRKRTRGCQQCKEFISLTFSYVGARFFFVLFEDYRSPASIFLASLEHRLKLENSERTQVLLNRPQLFQPVNHFPKLFSDRFLVPIMKTVFFVVRIDGSKHST